MSEPINARDFYVRSFTPAGELRKAADRWGALASAAEADGDQGDAEMCKREAAALRALARRKEVCA